MNLKDRYIKKIVSVRLKVVKNMKNITRGKLLEGVIFYVRK